MNRKERTPIPLRFWLCFVLLIAAPSPVLASPAPFYEGKTIRFVVGTGPGGGHDIHVRAIARHFGRFVPGQPRIIVQNMLGAGGVVAANYIQRLAKPDGLAVGFTVSSNVLLELTGHPGIEFNSRQLQWIGNVSSDVSVCLARRDRGFETISDVMRSGNYLAVASSGRGTTLSIYPEALNSVLETNFKVVEGYLGIGAVLAAVERGEVGGVCGWSWGSMKASRPDWLPKGFVRVLAQLGIEKHPELADVPWIMDLVTDQDDRRFLETLLAPLSMYRPFFVAPGVPKERVRLLRDAFMKVVEDPAFLREAEKMRLEISPTSGEEVENLVDRVFSVPPAILKRIATLLAP